MVIQQDDKTISDFDIKKEQYKDNAMTRSSDFGTILPSGTSALIVEQTGELNLYLANQDDDEEMTSMAQLLAAVLIRSEDLEWVSEMISSFETLDRSADRYS